MTALCHCKSFPLGFSTVVNDLFSDQRAPEQSNSTTGSDDAHSGTSHKRSEPFVNFEIVFRVAFQTYQDAQFWIKNWSIGSIAYSYSIELIFLKGNLIIILKLMNDSYQWCGSWSGPTCEGAPLVGTHGIVETWCWEKIRGEKCQREREVLFWPK